MRWLLAGLVSPAIVMMGGSASAQDVPPRWLRTPSAEQFAAAYPVAAVRAHVDGQATIKCEANTSGVLENCQVMSESPPGLGFGDAALLVSPFFLLSPPLKAGKPIRTITIPIRFHAGEEDAPLKHDTRRILTQPVWDRTPSRTSLMAAWPRGARPETVTGTVALWCKLDRLGSLLACETAQEHPGAAGFSRAARGLTSEFRLRVQPGEEGAVAGLWVSVPFRFLRPGSSEAAEIAVRHPRWVADLDPKALEAVFPAAAKQAGLRTGLGVVDCEVAADGALRGCSVAREDPQGLGFGEAALKVAGLMRMNPWTDEGRPVDGGTVKVPIRLTLPDPAPAKTPPP